MHAFLLKLSLSTPSQLDSDNFPFQKDEENWLHNFYLLYFSIHQYRVVHACSFFPYLIACVQGGIGQLSAMEHFHRGLEGALLFLLPIAF